MTITTGPGDRRVAQDLYRSAILREVSAMRREGVYVCFANVLARMPEYNQLMLLDTLWALAREGQLS